GEPWRHPRSGTAPLAHLVLAVAHAPRAPVRRSAPRRRRRQPPECVAERWFPPTRRPRRTPLRRPLVRTAVWCPAAPRLRPVWRSTHLAAARVLHPGGKRPAPHVAHTA